MPLSEKEQRLLEEMERSLYHNDPEFVATVGGRRSGTSPRSVIVGSIIGILGIAVIVTGVIIHLSILGVAGFVVLFVGVLTMFSGHRELDASQAEPVPHKVSFMDRMNDRWENRQDERDN